MKVKRGKDWVDEGPSGHHSIYGLAHGGGTSIARALPLITAGGLVRQTKAHRIKRKQEIEEKKLTPNNWSRFQLKARTKEQERRDRKNGRATQT